LGLPGDEIFNDYKPFQHNTSVWQTDGQTDGRIWRTL